MNFIINIIIATRKKFKKKWTVSEYSFSITSSNGTTFYLHKQIETLSKAANDQQQFPAKVIKMFQLLSRKNCASSKLENPGNFNQLRSSNPQIGTPHLLAIKVSSIRSTTQSNGVTTRAMCNTSIFDQSVGVLDYIWHV